MGRPSKYETHVKPHIDKIKKWSASGATDSEIATALNIAESTLYEYKKKYPELSGAFACGRKAVVIDIKAALYKKAVGYDYEEKKQYIKRDGSGDNVQYTEISTKHQPPSETAAAMLLRNYDDTYADSDNTTRQMKQQEAELRKNIANKNNWFDID